MNVEPWARERKLTTGYSPCPNDTFIFHALVTGGVDSRGFTFTPALEDVETLNRWAFERRLPVTKISFHAYGALRAEYALLTSGSALGRGCGPLLVSKERSTAARLDRARIAIPGRWTSAALLLRLFAPQVESAQLIEMPFHQILEQTARGSVDAGLIIHESRFTYAAHGLVALVDLGEWWEAETGQPIPLGGIIADRRLGRESIEKIQEALRDSVRHARRRPSDSRLYVKEHAQELADEVADAHIRLYVNDFTEDLGADGLRALDVLYKTAEAKGILAPYDGPLGVSI